MIPVLMMILVLMNEVVVFVVGVAVAVVVDTAESDFDDYDNVVVNHEHLVVIGGSEYCYYWCYSDTPLLVVVVGVSSWMVVNAGSFEYSMYDLSSLVVEHVWYHHPN